MKYALLAGLLGYGASATDCAYVKNQGGGVCTLKEMAVTVDQEAVNAMLECASILDATECASKSFKYKDKDVNCVFSTTCKTPMYKKYEESDFYKATVKCALLGGDCANDADCDTVGGACASKAATEGAMACAVKTEDTCGKDDAGGDDKGGEDQNAEDVENMMKCVEKMMVPMGEMMQCLGMPEEDVQKMLAGGGDNRRRFMDDDGMEDMFSDPEMLCSKDFPKCMTNFATGISALSDDEKCGKMFKEAFAKGEDPFKDLNKSVDEMKKSIGFMCVKNEKDELCMKVAAELMDEERDSPVTCDDLKATGCCAPTVMTAVTDTCDGADIPMEVDGETKAGMKALMQACTDIDWKNFCGGAKDVCNDYKDYPKEMDVVEKALKGEDVREKETPKGSSAAAIGVSITAALSSLLL